MDITADLINEARSAISKVPFKGADQYITERQNVIQKIADANKVRADDLMNAVRKNVGVESVGKGGMVSGIKAREKMLAAGKLVGEEAQSAKSFIADAEKYLLEEPLKKQDLALKTKKIVETASTPMETPYGKSFLSYTPEGKVAGMAGKVLRGAAKVAGPVGAAMTAGELGGALAEVRKLGAEKIAAKQNPGAGTKNIIVNESTGESFEGPEKMVGLSPEERLRVREMLKKLRGSASVR